MTDRNAPPLSGSGFDRDARTRMDEAALDAAWGESGARLLRVHGGRVAVERAANGTVQPRLDAVSGSRPPAALYLGRRETGPVFAQVEALEPHEAPAAAAGDQSDGEHLNWQHPFEFIAQLDRIQREIVTAALALGNWHLSHTHSPRDGQPTAPARGGWERRDPHGGEHFPRTDPAVIVLIEHEDRLLLGSNVLWESGRFSLLAGFVEAGESAEQAVVREVAEEAGILVDQVQYVASQPWPFPRSLMLGFRARLADGVLPADAVPDPEEISELRWFTRAELRDPAPDLILPGALSIARWLIDLWVNEGDDGGAS